MVIKLNVKEIVEMIYGSGDLLKESTLIKRAEIGSLIHREHQAKYQTDDQSEVFIENKDNIDGYDFIICGRIDGVIKCNERVVIEEIKSTVKDLSLLDEKSVPAHLAQAKMYAYFYLRQHQLAEIDVRLSYIHVITKKIKTFDFCYSEKELYDFYYDTVKNYLNWLKLIDVHETERNKSLQGLNFPYSNYRSGQKSLITAIYKNIISKDILYAIAPTGVGKTIASLFPALKAVNQSQQKIFYLTAKNLGKKIVLDTVNLLLGTGLKCKTIEITAKDLSCFQKTKDCDADKCPYARNYYGKLFAALQDIYNNEDMFNKETIALYAKKHQICPFEFSLDLSYYADIIICDYNYVFCPLTHLKRYFDLGSKYQPIILIDEAHNMSSRSRAMYSGIISKKQTLLLKEIVVNADSEYLSEFDSLINKLEEYESKIKDHEYMVVNYDASFVAAVKRLLDIINDFLEVNKKLDCRVDIINLLLDYIRFITVADYFDNNFVFALSSEKDDFWVRIDCLDAAKFLLKTLKENTLSSVFFSATLYPLPYYMKTLTEGEGSYICVDSPFDISRLKLILLDNVSTKYRHREQSIEPIIDTIRVLGNSSPGNYIVFFPSYQYLQMVYRRLKAYSFDFSYIVQEPDFTIREREKIIELFRNNNQTQIGLFVMGGMFSEGIDYIGDMLNGVIVIGVGLPHVGGYNNVAKAYYDRKFQNGFDFAYTYPGFTKVVQAVGRVIRCEEDYGVAILIDDRFTYSKYQKLFPKEWYKFIRLSDSFQLSEELSNFWIKFKY
ncbi:MAG: ATP-dependent DNA helicase [Bacilli bacterium]|nr:ATP-dependent DNA helicase [Bacilli bacterium]